MSLIFAHDDQQTRDLTPRSQIPAKPHRQQPPNTKKERQETTEEGRKRDKKIE
jgi:hypothetical protein